MNIHSPYNPIQYSGVCTRPAESNVQVHISGLKENLRGFKYIERRCERIANGSQAFRLYFRYHEQRGWALVISRIDGNELCYTTPAFVYNDLFEAKSAACEVAIENGALEFVESGKLPSSSENGIVVALPRIAVTSPIEETDPFVRRIIQCWCEWRPGAVKLKWYAIEEEQDTKRLGCALRVYLNSRHCKAYSVETKFGTFYEAKAACAKAAVLSGVLNFIKHGDGRAEPSSQRMEAEPTERIDLELFCGSLPKPDAHLPLPPRQGGSISWMNTIMQRQRLSVQYFFTRNHITNLYGAVLQVFHSGADSSIRRTYVADTVFLDQRNAKYAVASIAVSDGLREFTTPFMKKMALEDAMPSLLEAVGHVDIQGEIKISFVEKGNVHGAELVLTMLGSPWTFRTSVPAQYSSEMDATVGVICSAVDQGIYDHFPSSVKTDILAPNRKRKSGEEDGTPDLSSKRRKAQDGLSLHSLAANGNKPDGSVDSVTLKDDLLSLVALIRGDVPPDFGKVTAISSSTPGRRKLEDSKLLGTPSDLKIPKLEERDSPSLPFDIAHNHNDPTVQLSPQTLETTRNYSQYSMFRVKQPLLQSLLDHCSQNGLPEPIFNHESVTLQGTTGVSTIYKICAIIGKEKFELPKMFVNLQMGQERLAKTILSHLKSRIKYSSTI